VKANVQKAPIRFYKRRIKKLRKLAAEPDVDLWALDEVHFQQHGSRCRMWVPPEVKEPVLLHAPIRKSVGYSEPYDYATKNSFTLAKRKNSTLKAAGNS
jgi:hypothetical protein